MQTLRNSKLIARLVLVWFALFIGCAAASTVINPKNLQMVCSGGGVKIVDLGDKDGEPQVSFGMDCPLCTPVTLPPVAVTIEFDKPSPLAHALRPIAAAHIASSTTPPLPSRGPPAFFL